MMEKYGVIKEQLKKSSLYKKIITFIYMEAERQSKVIKKAVIYLLIFIGIYSTYNIFIIISTHDELLKSKQMSQQDFITSLEKEKQRYAELVFIHENKFKNTIQIDDTKNEVQSLYEALGVSGVVKVEKVDVKLKRADAAQECYNKALVDVSLSSNYKDISAFDSIVAYFTDVFIDKKNYEVIGVSNGIVSLELKSKQK